MPFRIRSGIRASLLLFVAACIPIGLAAIQACNPNGHALDIRVIPDTADVVTRTSFAFQAEVSGTLGHNVTWELVSGDGTLGSSGLYSAPIRVPRISSAIIRARSVVDPTRFRDAQIRIVDPPLSQLHGPTTGGTLVTVGGKGFDPTTAVYFGGVAAPVVERVSSSTIRVSTPPSASIAAADVEVRTGTESVLYPQGFRYSASHLAFQGSRLTPHCAGAILGYPPIADFNLDGISDIALPCGGGPIVAVYFGDGYGDFVSPIFAETAATGQILRLFTGDVDGDGAPDVLAESLLGPTTTVIPLLNRVATGGGFVAQPPGIAPPGFTIGDGAVCADLSGDGKCELVLGNAVARELQVWRNVDGVFVDFTLLSGAGAALSAVDLEADLDLDLIATYSTGFSLYFHQGGVFTNRVDVGMVTGPAAVRSVAAGDFDGNAELDFATTDSTTGTNVRVRYGKGGSLLPAVILSSGVFFGATGFASLTADVNADGADELFGYGSTVWFEGVVGTGLRYSGSRIGTSTTSVQPADLDSDLDLDAVSISTDTLTLTPYASGYTYTASVTLAGTLDSMATDASGTLLALSVRPGCGGVEPGIQTYERVPGSPAFGAKTIIPLQAGALPGRLRFVNADNDGRTDILVADAAAAPNGGVWLLSRAEDGTLGQPRRIYTNVNYPVADMAMADLDQDGNADLVVVEATTLQGEMHMYRGSGGIVPTFDVEVPSPSAALTPLRVAVADLDFDGVPEIVVGDDLGFLLVTDFEGVVHDFVEVGASPGEIAIADVDRDYVPDLVTLVNSVAPVRIVTTRGLGNLSFDGPTIVPIGNGFGTRMAFADADEDGNEDLLLGSSIFSSMEILRGGVGGLSASTERFLLLGPFVTADVDGVPPIDLIQGYTCSVSVVRNVSR